MKKIVILAMLAIVSLSACADKKIRVPFLELPDAAQELITKVYSSASAVSYVIMEKDQFSTEYKVVMNNQTKLEFDRHGKLKKAKSDTHEEALPKDLIPQPIREYVAQNYGQQTFIVEYECDSRFQDIELNTGLDLEFDKEGVFLRIDD